MEMHVLGPCPWGKQEIRPARASFVKNPTDGAHINLWQPLINKAFYEAKVASRLGPKSGYGTI